MLIYNCKGLLCRRDKMKSAKKKVLAAFLAFAMILTFFIIKKQAPKADTVQPGITTVKVHYFREDNNYEGWNLWVWDKGNNGDGSVYEFIGQDEDGVFAVIEMPTTSAVGVIVRTNDWAKDTGDVIVDTSNGDVDVYITSTGNPDTAKIEQKPLQFNYDKVNVKVHYYRFDEDYTNWDVWSWVDGSSKEGHGGANYEFTESDSYGKVASFTYNDMKGLSKIGFIVRKNDWSDREQSTLNDGNRIINLAYADKNGNVDVYVLQKEPKTFYAENQVDRSRKVLTARMDSLNEIYFEVNVPVDSKDLVTLREGENNVPAEVTLSEDRRTGVIKTESNLDMNKKYIVYIDEYQEKVVTLGNVMGSDGFKELYHYDGELGAIYSKEKTTFKVWAPTAEKVSLKLYKEGIGGEPLEVISMTKGEKGVWSAVKDGDIAGTFYTYEVTVAGETRETQDVYSKAVGVNGDRSMVVDLSATNPEGWETDKGPRVKNQTDAIIYEVHIRDISMDPNSGIQLKGTYKGFVEPGTKSAEGEATGIDHLKEMGVTHVHILPMYDFATVDETRMKDENYNKFNWGYDPKNYQVPEGSYSTDPYSGTLRIEEMKEMIKALHDAGIGVIMDSVYNHTYSLDDSCFTKTVPGYYYRQTADGSVANTSGCGNDTASERSMFRKYMIDSVTYWAKEYHIDGFRFDLMGIHDIETMNLIREELDKINPEIIMYGEGWDLGNVLPQEKEALKVNMKDMNTRIAAFSDDMRDGLKGHVFTADSGGFVNYNGKWKKGDGNPYTMAELKELVKSGIVASTKHDGIDYSKIYYSSGTWAKEPTQTVNYVSCHDNNTLWDRIWLSQPDASEEERIKMDKMANFFVLTSQGISFIHAGEEMLRTKPSANFNPEDGITVEDFDENSYKSPDSVNQIVWSRKSQYKDVVEYYKGLIKLRSEHPAFRMPTAAEIQEKLKFLDTNDSTIAYTITGNANGDKWNTIVVAANAGTEETEIELPGDNWVVVVNGEEAGVTALDSIEGNKLTVPARTAMVLVDADSYCDDNTPVDPEDPDDCDPEDPDEPDNPDNPDDPDDCNPDNPDKPDNPDDTEKPDNEKPDGDLPKTGGIPLADIMVAGLAAVSGGAYMVFRKRRK